MSRGRICLHAPLVYPLLAGKRIEFAGGAQVQQVAMAEGLRDRGFEVSIVVHDFGQPALEVRRGITLHRSLRSSQGLPGLRFFYPRMWKTLAALRRANAEVYYTRGEGLWCGVTCDFAHFRGASFVMGIAHDEDVSRELRRIPNPRERWMHRRALSRADAIVIQNRTQEETLRRDFGRHGELVRNLTSLPERAVDAGAGGTVVWLATYAPSKRPAWFVELARRLPEVRFVMAGTLLPPPHPRQTWEECRVASLRMLNLTVRGFVAREELDELYSDAALFVHTSPAEGIPNAVLEAWARAVPTVTCVDLDGAAARHGLGSVARDPEELVDQVRGWMADPAARRAAGARARQHVRSEYDPERSLERLAEIFGREAERARRRHGA